MKSCNSEKKPHKKHVPSCSRVVVLFYPLKKQNKSKMAIVMGLRWEQPCLPFPCFFPGTGREMILLLTSQILFPVSAIKQHSDSCILHAFCSFLSRCQDTASVPQPRSSWTQWDFQCAPSPGKGYEHKKLIFLVSWFWFLFLYSLSSCVIPLDFKMSLLLACLHNSLSCSCPSFSFLFCFFFFQKLMN